MPRTALENNILDLEEVEKGKKNTNTKIDKMKWEKGLKCCCFAK
jgi:hypothetical protein